MTQLLVRRLLVDLETPFARRWNGGDAFRTAFSQWRAWQSGWRLLFAKDGMIRGNYSAWHDCFAPAFHRSQHASEPSRQWRLDNTDKFTPMGAATLASA